MKIQSYLVLLFFCQMGWSQTHTELSPPDYIKTIVFNGYNQDQFPIVSLGTNITLTFDDLTAEEADYYYKITHYNYDWTPSDLLKSQYLNGMDNQRIENYSNSGNTIQIYSHYTLSIPNEACKPKVSGNYSLDIYNDLDELLFSRRFIIYEDKTAVGVQIKRSRDFEYLNTKQVVQFTINTLDTNIPNPKKDIKVAILQNYNWETAIFNTKPQYTLGKELIYRYDQETAFWAGNEYLNFDSKDIRSTTNTIARVSLEDEFYHLLYTNRARASEPYTYFPDINGNFLIRSMRNENIATDSEYTNVQFSLENTPSLQNKKIYVVGKFNNYERTEANEMRYNPKSGNYHTQLLLKQGFYNYKYVSLDANNQLKNVGGDFHQTENTYMVLVYFKQFGALYDSVIGVGFGNSNKITN